MTSTRNDFQILLVEDSPTAAELASYWLEDGLKTSFVLHRAGNLLGALEILRQGEMDLTILDLNLPDSYGIDTFRSIHAESSGVPIVVLSSDTDEELAVEAVRLGAQDYVFKNNGAENPLARPVRFAWERAQRQRAESALQANERQLYIARSVQQFLLPDAPPRLAGFDISCHCELAELVGGDYFDFMPMPDGTLGLVMADVSGHGMAAALMSVEVRAVLRSLVRQEVGLETILEIANELISPDLDGRFVTLFFGALRPETRTLRYSSAAHPSLLMHADGTVEKLESLSAPLGIHEGVMEISGEIVLTDCDLLILYTDGMIERFNPGDELFGLTRFVESLRRHRHRPAAEIPGRVWQELLAFSDGVPQADDETLVVVKVGQGRRT
jgi:serine phosphatase RsbU (regulator of sigma subunit)